MSGEERPAPTLPPDGNQPVIRAANRGQLQDWATALSAAGMPFSIGRDSEGMFLRPRPGTYADAMEEIRLFELENEGWPPEPPAESPPVIIPGQSVYHIIFLGFLGVCYYRLGPFDPAFTIHEASSNTPGWFQAGEFWRPITAMTMHADLEHLMWNLLSLALLVPIVGREIGAGAAWFLAFAAGGLANIINVYFQDADFSSVGASGAALAALGILVGLRFSTHILQSGMPARWWRPVAAGLALLGLFSHSPRVDMIGHFLGFALGILFGIGARMIPARLAQSKIQDVLAVATMLLLLGSWVWLFRAVG